MMIWLGFVTVPFLPVTAEAFRPLLPVLISLVTALGFARQGVDAASLRALFDPRTLVVSLVWLAVSQVVAAWAAVWLARRIGIPPRTSA